MIEPIELHYALDSLPAGRFPFRRWRWELWHRERMLAAGWRRSPLHAQRAVRSHALRYAHRVNGLHPLRTDISSEPEKPWGRQPVAVQWGEVHVLLTPRSPLDDQPSLAATG